MVQRVSMSAGLTVLSGTRSDYQTIEFRALLFNCGSLIVTFFVLYKEDEHPFLNG